MKHFLLVLIASTLFLQTANVLARFEDDSAIPAWAIDAVDQLESSKIMTGFGDGTFRPDQTLNRAEAVTLLMRMKDIDTSDYKAERVFSDVLVDDWFAPAVNVAVENEWVKGYDDRSFKPGNTLNRAEWATILYRAFAFETDHEHSGYKDIPSQSWFAEATNALHANGMLRSQSNFFGPAEGVTRAEAAWQVAILMQKPRLLGTSQENDFSGNLNRSSRRVAVKPRDFDANDQGYDIERKEIVVNADDVDVEVVFSKSSGWVDMGSFDIRNDYDVKSWVDSIEFRFPFLESGMGPADSFELKIKSEEGEEILQRFTTTGKVFIPTFDIALEPEEDVLYYVSIRAVEDAYFYPSIAKGGLSISSVTGLTQKELTSTSAQSSHVKVKARVTIEETKIADIEFDPNK